MTHYHDANAFDCGDGVPNLRLILTPDAPAPRIDDPRIGAGAVVMGLTIIGQLAILLAVLAGGDAVIGALAAMGLLLCGLTMLGARSMRSLATAAPSIDNPMDGPSKLQNQSALR